MKSRALEQAKKKTETLRGLLGSLNPASVLQYLAFEDFRLRTEGFASTELSSPFHQFCHIAGLLVTSSHPGTTRNKSIDERIWNTIQKLSTEIIECYVEYYFEEASQEEICTATRKIQEQGTVMQVFLQFVGAPVMRSGPQWQAHVENVYVPFDELLHSKLGFCASDLIRLVTRLCKFQQQQLMQVSKLRKNEERLHKEFVGLWDRSGWSLSRMKQEARKHPIGAAIEQYAAASESLWLFRRQDLLREDDPPSLRTAVSCLTVTCDGQPPDFPYISAANPAIKFPFVEVNDGRLICISPALLWMAAQNHFEPVLTSWRRATDFFENRDRKLEERTEEIIGKLPGKGIRIWRSICETPDGQFEHDLLLNHGDTWVVVEAKASKVRRSFFEPDKAYKRLRDDFHSDRGVQKAYEQAEGLRKVLLNPGPKELYDSKGKTVLELDGAVKEVLTVCVTGEYWGALGIDLSIFLEKDDNDPYPWCVFMEDLDAFVCGLRHKKKTIETFLEFLRERDKLHGHLIANDELEVAGHFLENGCLPSPKLNQKILFSPDQSSIFDEAYFKDTFGVDKRMDKKAEKRKFEKGLQDSFSRFAPNQWERFQQQMYPRNAERKSEPFNKIGRNAPCPCGSGIKYKKCCGSPGRRGAFL